MEQPPTAVEMMEADVIKLHQHLNLPYSATMVEVNDRRSTIRGRIISGLYDTATNIWMTNGYFVMETKERNRLAVMGWAANVRVVSPEKESR